MESGRHYGFFRLVEPIFRIVLGLVFLIYGLDKIPQPDDFALAIANYKLLPEVFVNLLAVVLPWVEVLCGLLLIFGQWVRSAALLSTAMLVVFVTAVSISLLRGLDISCGCFNTDGGRKIGTKLLVEDILLLVMSAVLVLKSADRSGWRALLGSAKERE
jgi:hypothetical protein